MSVHPDPNAAKKHSMIAQATRIKTSQSLVRAKRVEKRSPRPAWDPTSCGDPKYQPTNLLQGRTGECTGSGHS